MQTSCSWLHNNDIFVYKYPEIECDIKNRNPKEYLYNLSLIYNILEITALDEKVSQEGECLMQIRDKYET